ncbi:MAG: hypothetical protein LRY73_13415 [Bacillus sp. (in: Bacteria)]|nr:hypothetical protein [Bacillus sp. (in: firmicutes)]
MGKLDDIKEQIDDLKIEEIRELRSFLRREMTIRKHNQKPSEETPIITLVIQGSQSFHEPGKPSSYVYKLIKGNYEKTVKSPKLKEETANRALITGIIDAVQRITLTKAHIRVISKGSWGYTKMIRNSKSPNSDLLNQLAELLISRNFTIEGVLDQEAVNQHLQ